MVKLNRIYTRTGDNGTTGLVDGSRVSKADPLMAAIGTVEETNAVLGLALLDIESDGHRAMVSRIQNELFDLGADLATPYVAGEAEGAALRITPAHSTRIATESGRASCRERECQYGSIAGGAVSIKKNKIV